MSEVPIQADSRRAGLWLYPGPQPRHRDFVGGQDDAIEMLQTLSRDEHNMGPTGEEASSGGIRENQGQELQLANGLCVLPGSMWKTVRVESDGEDMRASILRKKKVCVCERACESKCVRM